MRILGSHLTLTKFRNPQASKQASQQVKVKGASQQAKKYTLGTDPKENTTSERNPKKIPPRNGPQSKYHPIVVVTKKQIVTKKQT
jgi:hypothetical protein